MGLKAFTALLFYGLRSQGFSWGLNGHHVLGFALAGLGLRAGLASELQHRLI